MIQDTTFIIDVLRDDPDALDILEILERSAQPEKISSITVLELYEGVMQSSAPDRKQAEILDVLDSKSVVAADHTVMKKAGKLSGQLITEGQRIDREDCIIAATALLEDEPVLTRNRKHFERIEALSVETY